MIPYIINAGLLVAGCLAFYKIFLQKETFYQLNRSMLMLCLLISFILPLIPIPSEWSFRKVKEEETHSSTSTIHMPVVSQIDIPPTKAIEQPSAQPEPTSPLSRQATVSAEEPRISIAQVLHAAVWLYWFGVIVLALNFLLQLIVLTVRAYTYPSFKEGKYTIVELNGDQAPCSFLHYIFINPRKYDLNTYNQILLHEKVHVSERHSIDILFAEIMIIFQWFNPFAWMYRKEMENNLEFLTDETVLRQGEMEITTYQMSLLKVSAAHLPLSLTTNYNQSLLKKRIAMMNARKSNLNSGWKYFFLLPMLVLFACLLNEPIAHAQDKKPATKSTSKPAAQKQATPAKQSKPAAKATASKPAKEKSDKHADNDGMKTEGYWFATIKGDKIDFEFTDKNQRDEYRHSGGDFKLCDFPNLPKGTTGDFFFTREAGTLQFNGKFDGNEGSGTYKFVADKSYADFINQRISDKLDAEDQIVFFMLDVKKSYVQMLNDEGYTKLDKDNVIAMTALNVDKTHIEGLRQNGFTNVDADDIISTRALGITGDYIKEIRDAGYKDISLDQLVSFKAQGIDKDYLAKLIKMKIDNEKMDADDVISYKAMGIDDTYADQFKQLGYNNIKHDDLVSMKAVGVTPEFIKSFQNVGYKDATVENLISMKSVGVTPEFLKGFQTIGYKEIDAEDLISLKAVGVTPDFIKGFQQIGYKDIPIDQAISVKAVGVTPGYVKEMKQKGFNYNNLEKYITLKSIGTSD